MTAFKKVDRSPDSDVIWEIQESMKNQFEADVDFTKNGLESLYQELSEIKYRSLEKGDNFSVEVSDKGTDQDSAPCYRTTYTFDKVFNFKQVLKTLVNNRDLWDDIIEHCFDIRKPLNRL